MQRIVSLVKLASNVTRCGLNNLLHINNTVQNNAVNGNLLAPFTPLLNQVNGLKVKRIVRRRCKSCYFVVRDDRWYVMCHDFGRHKQVAMKRKPHNTWILTHATQGRVRPW